MLFTRLSPSRRARPAHVVEVPSWLDADQPTWDWPAGKSLASTNPPR